MPGYWLFKSEPDAFGIDDLAAADKLTTRWDGIRNYQARNFIRDKINRDDLVFFYHSSCKHVGIAGTCTVVSLPYPDPTQFDPSSPYFDSKATPEKPRWFSVDISLCERFSNILPVKLLKNTLGLENMMLMKSPRLSIQPVSSDERQLIMKMVSG